MEATVCRALSLGLTAPHFAEIAGYRGGALGPFTSSHCHIGQRWACRVVVLSNCRPMGNYDYLLAALGRIIDHLYLWFVGVIIQITCVCSYSKPEYHQLSYFACKTVSPTVTILSSKIKKKSGGEQRPLPHWVGWHPFPKAHLPCPLTCSIIRSLIS